MTHKEFYIWLEGYLYGKLDKKHIEVAPIVEKMGQVKEVKIETNMLPFQQIPIPINPLPKIDPYSPPYEVYCGDKTQLND